MATKPWHLKVFIFVMFLAELKVQLMAPKKPYHTDFMGTYHTFSAAVDIQSAGPS